MKRIAAVAVTALLGGCGGGTADDASTTTSSPVIRSSSSTTNEIVPSTVETSANEASTTQAPMTTLDAPGPPNTEVSTVGGATELMATSSCQGTPPHPSTTFTWTPSGRGVQRIDVTVTADGFETGAYESIVADLPASATSYQWVGPDNESTNLWRVVALADGVAIVSETATFAGPGCVGVDMHG